MAEPAHPTAGDLAQHVEDSVESLAQFHQEHYRTAPRLQRAADAVTGSLGRPLFAAVAVLLLTVSIFYAASIVRSEHPAFDILHFVATAIGIAMAVLILVTQRREEQLEESRSKLTLELALLADRRTAKLIALVEELRREKESEDMAEPVDPKAVFDVISERTTPEEAGR
jgi:uncharacterized membrane protein